MKIAWAEKRKEKKLENKQAAEQKKKRRARKNFIHECTRRVRMEFY